MIDIVPIPALVDTYNNYIWLLIKDQHCCVVDPGDARPVLDYIDSHNLTIDCILITHYHGDHIGGVRRLRACFEDCTVYAPDHPKITHATHTIKAGDTIEALGVTYDILDVSGHTLDHIAYLSTTTEQPWLFCGDALFSAGCGRLFEGTPKQMHDALMLMADLPENTKMYCAHEYTLSNLQFAAHVEPENTDITDYNEHIRSLREQSIPSLPSSIGTEKRINPFLRCEIPSIIHSVNQKFAANSTEPHQTFALLRQWKDNF